MSRSRPPRSTPASAEPPRLRVGFVLAPRFTLSAFASFVDVLRLAADEGDRSRPILCDWRVVAPGGDGLRSSCGVPVAPDEDLGDPSRFDYVVVVGGLVDDTQRLPAASVAFLRRAAALGVPLVGICTGAFVLHRAGLMDGYRCCVSWFHHDDFLEQFDGMAPVSDRIFVVDRDRLTCSGGTSSAHLAAYLVERHLGRAAARKSLHIMMIDAPMEADEPQPGLPLDVSTDDPLVRRALHIVQQSLDAPPSVAAVAERLGVSRRRLERHFGSALSVPPAEAFTRLRLLHAQRSLTRPGQGLASVAAECGFCDASHLIRVFKAHTGTTPRAWRPETALLDSAAAPR